MSDAAAPKINSATRMHAVPVQEAADLVIYNRDSDEKRSQKLQSFDMKKINQALLSQT